MNRASELLFQHGVRSTASFPFPISASLAPNPSQQQAAISSIRQSRIIACVRAQSADLALDVARAALDGGLSVLEVTMNTPGAVKAISKLVEEYPFAFIGAGTVLNSGDAMSAKDAGAKFLMSPIAVQEMIETHRIGPTLFIPGAITPNEVFNAFDWGACLVKLYPVTLMGGLKLVQAIHKAMPFIPLVASQGISLELLEKYLKSDVTAVVLSDAIFQKSLVEAKDFKKIQQRATIAAEKVAALHAV